MADSAVTGNGNATRKAFTTPDELAKGPGNGFVNPPTSIAVLHVAPDPIAVLRLYCLLKAGQSESYDGVNVTRHYAASSLSRAGPIHLESASSM